MVTCAANHFTTHVAIHCVVANCGRTSITVSEEEEKPVVVESVSGGYVCCFDPIDG